MKWRSTRLKAVVTCPVAKSDGGPRPFVGLEDIASGTGTLLTQQIPVKAAPDAVIHAPGDVLFSKLRPYLAKSLLVKHFGTATGELLVLRARGEISHRYLFYVTLSKPWLDLAVATSYGSKMPRTSWEAMSEFRLALPPLDEQRRIAEFLDAQTLKAHRVQALRKDQVAIAQERYRCALDAIFNDSFFAPTRLKYLLQGKPRYGVLVPQYVSDGVPLIRVNDLNRLEERLPDLPKIPEALSRRFPATIVRPGDVLVSVVGTLGRSTVAPAALAGANVNRPIAVLRASRGVSPELISAWTGTAAFERQALEATASDSAQPTLGMGDLNAFEVNWPGSEKDQRMAVRHLRNLRSEFQDLQRTLKRHVDLTVEGQRALITAAVTGQIDITTARGITV